jgi:tRNA nucleotidyltransferase (CCA-adding enzyme)
MVPELSEAAKDATIKDALINKISRERIGTEIDKMLSGPSPFLSLQLIHQYGLYPTVFTSPSGVPLSQPPEDAAQAVSAMGAVQWLLRETTTTPSPLRTTANKEERRTLYLAAALLPYLSVMSEIKNRPIHAVQLVLRDSLKSPNHDVNTVSTLFRGVPLFQQAVHSLDQQHAISRSELGLLIRDIGALWQPCLKLALVQDLLQQSVAWANPDTLDTHLDVVSGLLARYERLLDQAYKYGIQDAHTWRPMIDVSGYSRQEKGY